MLDTLGGDVLLRFIGRALIALHAEVPDSSPPAGELARKSGKVCF